MRGVFGRLGMVGAILLASLLIFGAIAGSVVLHRLQTAPAVSHTQEQRDNSDEQGDNSDEQGDNADQQGDGRSKPPRPAQAGHPSPEPDDSQDKDT